MEIFPALKLAPFFILLSTLSFIVFFIYIFSLWKQNFDIYKELLPPQDIEEFKALAKNLRKKADKKFKGGLKW